MPSHWAQQYIRDVDGPFSHGRFCAVCGHLVSRRKPLPGHRGRGYGFRVGNQLRGEMIQHIKTAHPELKPDE